MGLGDRVANTLLGWAEDVVQKALDWTISPIMKYFVNNVGGALIKPELMKSVKGKQWAAELKAAFSGSPETPAELVEAVILNPLTLAAREQLEDMSGVKIGDDTPITKKVTEQMALVADVAALSNLVGILGELVPTTQLGQIGAEVRAYMDYSGVSQVTSFGYGMMMSNALGPIIAQEIQGQIVPNILDQSTIRLLHYREVFNEEQYNDAMRLHGINKERAGHWFKAGEVYPGGTDFIRYAVRDVFNPEAVALGKLDEAFPAEILPFAAKAGMTEEVLLWEWMSHWILPSPSQGFEMLHRKIIDETQLRQLLKIADFAPGWIDPLIGISFAPYTRVDARRMFETGVLSESEYIEALEEIGLPHDKALKLVEWTKVRIVGPDRDLTKAQILDGWELGLIDTDDTVKLLMESGYDEFEASVIMGIEDRKEFNKLVREQVKTLRTQFAFDALSEADFRTALSKLGVLGFRQDTEIEKGRLEAASRRKLPSKEDILKWFDKDMITVESATFELKRLGYQDQHIKLYLEVKT